MLSDALHALLAWEQMVHGEQHSQEEGLFESSFWNKIFIRRQFLIEHTHSHEKSNYKSETESKQNSEILWSKALLCLE